MTLTGRLSWGDITKESTVAVVHYQRQQVISSVIWVLSWPDDHELESLAFKWFKKNVNSVVFTLLSLFWMRSSTSPCTKALLSQLLLNVESLTHLLLNMLLLLQKAQKRSNKIQNRFVSVIWYPLQKTGTGSCSSLLKCLKHLDIINTNTVGCHV